MNHNQYNKAGEMMIEAMNGVFKQIPTIIAAVGFLYTAMLTPAPKLFGYVGIVLLFVASIAMLDAFARSLRGLLVCFNSRWCDTHD